MGSRAVDWRRQTFSLLPVRFEPQRVLSILRVNERTDQQLLREYAERRSEAAFSELVRRHIDLVYSAALRMVRDPHLAEDQQPAPLRETPNTAGHRPGSCISKDQLTIAG